MEIKGIFTKFILSMLGFFSKKLFKKFIDKYYPFKKSDFKLSNSKIRIIHETNNKPKQVEVRFSIVNLTEIYTIKIIGFDYRVLLFGNEFLSKVNLEINDLQKTSQAEFTHIIELDEVSKKNLIELEKKGTKKFFKLKGRFVFQDYEMIIDQINFEESLALE